MTEYLQFMPIFCYCYPLIFQEYSRFPQQPHLQRKNLGYCLLYSRVEKLNHHQYCIEANNANLCVWCWQCIHNIIHNVDLYIHCTKHCIHINKLSILSSCSIQLCNSNIGLKLNFGKKIHIQQFLSLNLHTNH